MTLAYRWPAVPVRRLALSPSRSALQPHRRIFPSTTDSNQNPKPADVGPVLFKYIIFFEGLFKDIQLHIYYFWQKISISQVSSI